MIDRFYDPATGQFLTVEPLVDDTAQSYAYTGDDRVNVVDADGQIWSGLFDVNHPVPVS